MELLKTKVDVNFQLLQHDQDNQVTSLIVVLSFMIVFDKFVISGTISQVNHIDGRIVNEPSELSQEEVGNFGSSMFEYAQSFDL